MQKLTKCGNSVNPLGLVLACCRIVVSKLTVAVLFLQSKSKSFWGLSLSLWCGKNKNHTPRSRKIPSDHTTSQQSNQNPGSLAADCNSSLKFASLPFCFQPAMLCKLERSCGHLFSCLSLLLSLSMVLEQTSEMYAKRLFRVMVVFDKFAPDTLVARLRFSKRRCGFRKTGWGPCGNLRTLTDPDRLAWGSSNQIPAVLVKCQKSVKL